METWFLSVSSNLIIIPRVEVFPGRLRLLVRLLKGAPRFTSREMIAKAVAVYPTLMHHSCINSKGPDFGAVAIGTAVPHLLEHLVIAEQVSIARRRMSNRLMDAEAGLVSREETFVGTTEWLTDPSEGETCDAIVEISFVDDLEALEALNRALDVLRASL